MNIVRNAIFLALTILLPGCAADSRPKHPEPAKSTTSPAAHSSACGSATDETLMDIREHESASVSICRLDGKGDCLYTETFGKTFVAARPDLDGNGADDFLIKDFSGAYGNHDIVHHLGYIACPEGGYVKVLDAFVTSVQVEKTAHPGEWAGIEVVRDCYDDNKGSITSRRYTLSWQEADKVYGPPDNDPDLAGYCTSKEMSRP